MEQQIYHQMSEIENEHWWFVGRRNIIQDVIESLKLPKHCRILDVGCGTGGNLSLLSRYGNVTGVELDDQAREIAQSKNMASILKGKLPHELPVTKEKFDLVLLLDVLEHIEEDVESLERLKDCLAPGGYMILTVPACPFLWGQHDEDHHHKRRYLYSSLSACIEKAGLKAKHMTYYNSWLFPVVSGVRLFRGILPLGTSKADLKIPNRMVNDLLKIIFSSERYYATKVKIPFGVSLLSIIQK